jgi:hypothetical protein
MNFKKYVKQILTENPVPPTKQLNMFDYGQDGNETVLLSPESPQHLKDLAGEDNEAILVSVNPYKIKFKNDDQNQEYLVYPKDIVIESEIKKEIVKYAKEYLNYLTGGK